MKLTAILLFVACFQVSARAYTQDRVTLARKNASLSSVLDDIEAQTGYHYFFNAQWENEAKRVTIEVKNADIRVALDICFKEQPFSYEIVRNTIVVKKKETDKRETVYAPAIPVATLISELSGMVMNEKREPLAGASVLIRNSSRGTTTNSKGVFQLKDVSKDAVIEASYSGYQSKLEQLHGQTSLSMVLSLSNITLDQVQVIAYGTTTKRLNTGDVTTVTSKEIEEQPITNPLLAMQGRVPGMSITQSTGLPGSGVTIQIRGQNSISNGNDPLYIIDGVPYSAQNYLPGLTYILGTSSTTSGGNFTSGSPFSYINPADIESIDVLKDADATAIYGTRGANGVILITTKKGKTGQTRFDFNVQRGAGKVAEKMKLLNDRQYLDMRYEAFRNDGASPSPTSDYDLTLWDTTRNTDWQKLLLGGTANYIDAQGSVSGGNANTQFFIGAGYNRQTTVFPGDFADQKGSAHFSISNTSPNQKFNIQLSGLYLVDDNKLSGYDLTQQALQLAPDAPAIYNPDGTINWAQNAAGVSTWTNYNPAAMLLLKYKTETQNLISNAILTYHLIPGLDVKSSFGFTNTQTNEVQTIPLSFYDPATRPYVQRKADFADNNTHSWIIEPQLSYNRSFGEGTLSALVGMTLQENNGLGRSYTASGFASDLVLEDIQAATTVVASSDVQTVYKYNAGFGKLSYNWKDKYLTNLTVRRDGSSRFGPANQFHNFGSVGVGWIFSKEEFVQRNASFLSFGKLRGSLGTTGSDQVGDYTFMDLYAPFAVGVPYQNAVGYTPTRIFTPNLSWEETRKLEVAAELGFLKDRIFLSASFYRNRSSNQLLGYLLPSIAGFTSIEKNLDATVQNKGWEFELRTVNLKIKDFRWTSSVNFTMNRNLLLSGAKGLSEYYQQQVGHPLGSLYVYHSLGVDPFTGRYEFADSHGSPTSTPNLATDATVLINFQTKFYGGFQNGFSYKGLQVDILFQFTKQPNAGNYLYKTIPGSFNGSFGGNQSTSILNHWQEPGDVKPFQRFSQNGSTTSAYMNLLQSDQAYMDGSFIRLKNVSVSWQLPRPWQKQLHLQNARLYVHAQNLLTFTHYTGLDPETGSNTLPPLRVITGGVQVSF